MPKFSVIIPTRNRPVMLVRAVNSILHQTCQDWELVLIEDGSTDATPQVVRAFAMADPRIRALYHDVRQERCISRNEGYDAATGEWICNLDSDDEWISVYLEVLDFWSKRIPEAMMFNCGAVVYHKRVLEDGTRTFGGNTYRHTWTPRWLEDEGRHEDFKAGKMGTGQFVFKRECWEQVERLPEARSPYKLHELAPDVHHLYPYPPKVYGDGRRDHGSLGNPWGDDWLLLYRLTRKFRMYPIETCLYIHHVR